MLGLTFDKLLVVLVLAAVIIGPQRLPAYAHRLAAFVRTLRAFVETTRTRVETEVGATLAVDEWRSLDPRQYDPRRIVREALAAPAAGAEVSPSADAEVDRPADDAPTPSTGSDAEHAVAQPAVARPDATDRERANRIAAVSPGGWRPAVAERLDD